MTCLIWPFVKAYEVATLYSVYLSVLGIIKQISKSEIVDSELIIRYEETLIVENLCF